MKCNVVQLGELCRKVVSGGTPKSTITEFYDGDIPWLNTKEVHFNRISQTERKISTLGLENSSAKWIPANCVIVAMYGATAGNVAVNLIPMTTNQACCNLEIDETRADYRFIYYYLKLKYMSLSSLANGGAQQNLNTKLIKDFPIVLPPLNTQIEIANLLWALDDKIELNNKINVNLEQQAQALFKAWFVDFEPFGGKMPEDWRKYKLSEFLPVVTGKKNANVSSDDGKYPFFSCSQGVSWTDEYSFEGSAILVAGNGDFNVKWYNGKFEAYQRTYVLIPYNARLTGWLYYAIKHNLAEITSAARGSVIKFITKGNLDNFGFYAPVSLAELDIINTFGWINQMIDHNIQENYRIMRIRDGLLPKLMSGEIRASDVSFPKL